MKMLIFTVALFFSLICQVHNSIEKAIKDDILKGYDKVLRPVKNLSDLVTVQLNPALYSLINVDAVQQEITLKQWYRMFWTDQFLTWNPEAYGGLSQIKISRSEVWLPDIRILTMTEQKQLSDDEYVVMVNSDGSIRTSIDQLVTVYCPFDVSNFPYDTQNCGIIYSSWSFNANEIDLNVTHPTDLGMYLENNEWTLRNYTANLSRYTAEGGTYVSVSYNIKITRKPSYYVNTFMWPSFIITCISIVGVFSPFNEAGEREERVSLGLTTLLTMAVILMIVTDQMPKSSNGMPLLGVFVILEIAVAVIATLFATAMIHLHSRWMKNKHVCGFLLTIMCLPNERKQKVFDRSSSAFKKDSISIHSVSNVHSSNDGSTSEHDREKLRQEWSAMTKRLDFCCLITFLIVNSAAFAIILFVGNAKLDN